MLVQKKEMLEKLAYLAVAVAAKNNNLQMDCLVFDGHAFHTFNDDMAVSVPVPELKGVPKFAAKFKEFQAFIAKWPRDDFEFEVTDTHVCISNKRARARVACESQILMPYNEWNKGTADIELDRDFSEGLALVAPVCGKDSTRPLMTCVWLYGRNIIATDSVSLARFKLGNEDLPTDAPIYLPAAAAAIVSKFSALAYGVSANNQWMFFRVGDKKHKAIIACRTPSFGEEGNETLQSMLALFKHKMLVKFDLPARLEEILDRASVILREEVGGLLGLLVRVELETDWMTITTTSQLGDYTERQRVDFKGQYIDFYVNAEFLAKAIKDRQTIGVCDRLVRVYGKNFDYLVARAKVHEEEVDVNPTNANTHSEEVNPDDIPF